MKKKFIIIFFICFIFIIQGCAFNSNIVLPTVKITTPDERFVDNNNGTILDKKTNLMWEKCSEGLSGKNCASGTANEYTWEKAKNLAQNTKFVGYDNWRLPTIKELSSIVERAKYEPAINQNIFPNTKSSYYWSSSVCAGYTDRAWRLDFSDGDAYWHFKTVSYYVRLVRSRQ